MALRLVQFLAIMLTALALVPSGAHLAALPKRSQWRRQPTSSPSRISAGWVLFGIVLFGALAANLAHTIVLRRLGRSFGYALASFLLIAANLESSRGSRPFGAKPTPPGRHTLLRPGMSELCGVHPAPTSSTLDNHQLAFGVNSETANTVISP